MPGFGVENTGVRTGILVLPAHDGGLYLASIGCLNPTHAVGPHDNMDIDESRGRVIDLLDSLKAYDLAAFQTPGAKRIYGASIVILYQVPLIMTHEPICVCRLT